MLAAVCLHAQTLSVDKTSMTFSAQSGGAKVSQTLNISNSSGPVSFSANTNTTNPNWLTVNPQTGSTPSAVTVTADPAGLSAGIYGAQISISAGGTLALLVPVSFSVSSIGASPQSLQFSMVVGNIPVSQIITLSSQPTSFSAVANSTSGWLTVGPATGNSPATLTVGVNAFVPLSPGTYNGSILITPANSPSLTVLVTLTVTPTPPITVSPISLNLDFQNGGTNNAAASQNLTVSTTAGQPLSFNLSSTVASNPSGKIWITPLQAAVTGANGSAVVTVAYDTTVPLPPGTYAGNVQVAATGFTPATTNVPVTLLVSNSPLLIVPAAPLNFTYELSGPVPPSQSVTATATSGTIPFTVVVTSPTNGGSWIVVTPATGFSSGTPFSISVNPVNLLPGNYTGTVTVTPAAGTGNGPQQIPVTLTIANDPLIVANGCVAPGATCSLSFAYQLGQSAPASQNISVNSSTGAPLIYTATPATTSCGSWLGLTGATGLGNGVVTVSVLNPTSLVAGTCNGTISIAATNAATGLPAPNSPVIIPVTLLVSNSPLLLVSPPSLTFTVPVNGQVFQVVSLNSTNPATPLNYTVTFTPISGANWISVNQVSGTTPNSLQITATPGPFLSAGNYTGTVTVAATGPGGTAVANSPVTIPLTLQVTAGTLSVSPTTLSFSQLAGAPASAAQNVQVSSNGQQLSFTAVASTNSSLNWLSVSPASGTTNGNFLVTADGSKLTPGTYTGFITVTAAGPGGSPVAGNPATVQVTLVVSAGAISATPASLTFTQAAGGAAPAAQTVTVSGTPGPINFTVGAAAAGGGAWLTATPANGSTPGTIQVSASAGTLGVGQYTGTVTITAPAASGSPISIPVTLNVVASQVITATPATLTFNYVIGTPVPAAQQVQATTTGSSIPLSMTAGTKDGANWLSVTPAAAATPAALAVAVSPQTLAAGTYTGAITISSPNAAIPATVAVTLTVAAVPTPVINAIANAASFANASLAPGENIVIFGSGIGPATLVGLHVTNGVVDTLVGGTRVLFDGVAAPVIYASAIQTSVMVPYGVANRTSTNVQVEFLGVQSAAHAFTLIQTTPGIYTLNQAGTGPGATLNQDGSVNGAAKPAAKGSVVAVYMTGEGQTTPVGADGAVIPVDGSGLKNPNLAVTATVGGIPATVLYAGSAPGIVSGVMQVNVQIPAGAPSGSNALVIAVGTTPSQSGVTVAVQ